jgi:predicted metal-dependent HD superfamily phosphohydrolase
MERFTRCWRALGARTDDAAVVLAARWNEPHRHYHTGEHLEECLAWLDTAIPARREELELAIFFHDAVYDPSRADNEAASAALMATLAREAGLREDVIARVSALILSTAQHGHEHGDAALLSDIDLAILGASPARYARFERDVRREYAQYDDASYGAGRARVLSGFLERLSIYRTPSFARLEAQARDNLAAALSALRTPAR